MAFLAAVPVASWLTAASIAGTVMTVAGQIQQGRAEKAYRQAQARGKEFEAAQLEQQATQELAASQRESAEQRRQAQIMSSRALALAAASGGGATDPTVVDIISDIEGEGAYRAGVALYEGEERARLNRMGAKASRYEAATGYESASSLGRAGNIAAIGSIFGAAGQIGGRMYEQTMYGKYGLPSTKPKTGFGFGDNVPYVPGIDT